MRRAGLRQGQSPADPKNRLPPQRGLRGKAGGRGQTGLPGVMCRTSNLAGADILRVAVACRATAPVEFGVAVA